MQTKYDIGQLLHGIARMFTIPRGETKVTKTQWVTYPFIVDKIEILSNTDVRYIMKALWDKSLMVV